MQAANDEITSALKVAMKSRGITYKHIADKLGVSEKTIKRLFRDKDCSISRLTEICRIINLSVYDLLDFARRYTEPRAKLSEEQEYFLQNNACHFYFLFFLISGHTPDQIQSLYQLSDVSIFRYLRDLDRLEFIELSDNNRYRLLVEGKLLMQLHGPLHETIKGINQLFLHHVIDHDNQPDASFISSFRYMTPENLSEMIQEFYATTQKYRKIAHQDEAIMAREKLIPVKWATLAARFDVCGKWPLDEHNES